MKIAGIIPARYASSRFPGKALTLINGKPMIQLVYEQASKANSLHGVYVATDDMRILEEVKGFGGKALLTSTDHRSGTERCNEAALKLMEQGIDMDAIINIQGDEPLINPQQIDIVASLFSDNTIQIASLVKKISRSEELFDPNVVKAIVGTNGKAIYFSRQTIPYIRDTEKREWLDAHNFYKHIGIYGYTAKVLGEIVALKESPLEKAESLEQLRWLENGYGITIKETEFESFGIDTPEDLSKIKNIV
ncbi:MAG: 3-deoxy-manno-octulosonate cytidylyltransferase [Bacteroidetes bacterium]|nr:MAG: 3-deoxy-manno-octulosonate cytidylyltransferase [Bacteroidota bacterium]